jgi:hypothetical protein
MFGSRCLETTTLEIFNKFDCNSLRMTTNWQMLIIGCVWQQTCGLFCVFSLSMASSKHVGVCDVVAV